MVRARLPASPLFSVSGREPRARCFGFGGPAAGMFALDPPRPLCFRFSGANLGPGISGLAARRPAFPRRGLLPPPREPLQLRPGEQNLHTDSAPPPGAGRFFQGAVCSPLPANPCGSVPGSKFFTQIPRRKPVPGGPEHAPPRVDTQKKHLAGSSARCFPLSNSSPAGLHSLMQFPVPRGTFN